MRGVECGAETRRDITVTIHIAVTNRIIYRAGIRVYGGLMRPDNGVLTIYYKM